MRERISSLLMRRDGHSTLEEEVVVVVMEVVMDVVVVLRQGLSPLRALIALRGVGGLARPSTLVSRLMGPHANGPSPAAVGRRGALRRGEEEGREVRGGALVDGREGGREGSGAYLVSCALKVTTVVLCPAPRVRGEGCRAARGDEAMTQALGAEEGRGGLERKEGWGGAWGGRGLGGWAEAEGSSSKRALPSIDVVDVDVVMVPPFCQP
jgi:hypothetical protein